VTSNEISTIFTIHSFSHIGYDYFGFGGIL